MGFVSFNDEPEQYLCAAVLRPGNVTAAVGAVGILRRLMRMIRYFLPGVRIRVRLDGGFAHPEVLGFLDAEPNFEYCRGDGQKCGVEAQGQTGHATGPQALAAQRQDRARLRRSQLRGPHLAATTPRHHQGRGGPGRGQRAQRQSALRHHQHEAEPAVDLRKGLLPARRNREPNQGTARRCRSTAPVAATSGPTSSACC